MYPQTAIKPLVPYKPFSDYTIHPHKDYYEHPEKYRMDPFRICGGLYYVGDKKGCPHLIDTGDGLILIDTGYGPEAQLLMDNIISLGFQLEDIKMIIHTHGHYDHFGATEKIKAISGAKVYMGAVETKLLRQMPERALVDHSYDPDGAIPWPDVELEDGDHIRLGNTDITCVLAPGHTYGTMCFFFTVTEGSTTYRVGYWGGVGMNCMHKVCCREYNLPEGKFQAMLETIDKLWNEPVDITLGNHPPQNCTIEKRKWMLSHPGTNPFIDKTCWQAQLMALKENCEKAIALDY